MFQEGNELTRKFTTPIVICWKTIAGKCSAGIGAGVIINNNGWLITADHIVAAILEFKKSAEAVAAFELQKTTIEKDPALSAQQKIDAVARLTHPNNDDVDQFSAWFGDNGWTISEWHRLPTVDIAVGQIKNFVPPKGIVYPKFKDPSKSFQPGASLCKLGFPFHNITVTFDRATGFHLPASVFPIPFFPMDGIYTRDIHFVVGGGTPPPFPFKLLETSTPGLRGQSGGPTFDTKGAIWAIQSKTVHLELGFEPTVGGVKEHQFLNIGQGAHVETVLGFLKHFGISFELAAH